MRRALLGLLLATVAAAQTIPTPSPTAQSIATVSAPLSLLNQTLSCTSCVSALSAVGSSPSANGASLTGNTLTLQPADGTHPGLLTSGTQTIGGDKTFSGAATFSNSGGISLTGNLGILHLPGTGGYITSVSGLTEIQQTGDALGQSEVFVGAGSQGSSAGGGIENDGIDVVAWQFITSTGAHRSLVLEDRGGDTFLQQPELQFPSGGSPSLVLSDTKVMARTGLIYKSQTLDTCAAGLEGTVERDVLSGANTGHGTRLCLCRSTGANAYAWQNLAGTSLIDIGTNTTCPD
jgi:hypothetical protein